MNQIFLTTLCLLLSSLSFASTSFHGEDFNSMIKENQKAESELRSKLQKEAGIRFDDQPGTLSREKLAIANEGVEQIVVPTSDIKSPVRNRKSAAYSKVDEETSAKRLAQEFKEAN